VSGCGEPMLAIPLSGGTFVHIPRQMSEEDFLLIIDTLDLWRVAIVKKPQPKPDTETRTPSPHGSADAVSG
jgi:hypothetical protein